MSSRPTVLKFKIYRLEPFMLTITGLSELNRFHGMAISLASAIRGIKGVASCTAYDNNVIDVVVADQTVIDLVADLVAQRIRDFMKGHKIRAKVMPADVDPSRHTIVRTA